MKSIDSIGGRIQYCLSLLNLKALTFISSYRGDCGVSYDLFMRVIRTNKITKKMAARIIRMMASYFLVVDFSWLLTGKGVAPQLIYSDDEDTREFDDYDQELIIDSTAIKDIEAFRYNNQRKIIMEYVVKDYKMKPFYSPGDFVAGELYDQLLECSCYFIVEQDNQVIGIRIVKPSSDPNKYKLYSLNSDNPSVVDKANINLYRIIFFRTT